MLDANAELARLRQRLRFKGLSDAVVDSICDEAAAEISATTADLLADAMNEAVNAGGDAMSVDFIDELRAKKFGSSYEIGTDSGQTDFSTAPFPMLPRLLKNAKVAKDGSLYKVIPLKQKNTGEKATHVARTTESAMQNINSARQAAKQESIKEDRSYASQNAMKGMDTVSAMQQVSKTRSSKFNDKDTEVTVNFRTASSKQDPNTQWVHPGKKADLTQPLQEINANLQDAIDKAIDDIIRRLEELYW